MPRHPLGGQVGRAANVSRFQAVETAGQVHTHEPLTRTAASGRRSSGGLGRPLTEPAVSPERRAPKDRRVTTSQRRAHQAPRPPGLRLAPLRHPRPRQQRQAVCNLQGCSLPVSLPALDLDLSAHFSSVPCDETGS